MTFGYPPPDSADGTALRKLQLEAFQKVFSKIDKDIPLVCTCGNHDIGNRPTMANIEGYRRDFG